MRIRSTSRASANWEPWASSSRPRSGSAGCVIGVRTCRRADGEARASLVAATAVAVAFAVGAGLDWLWQLPAVSLVGVSALALALGSPSREPATRRRPGMRAALAGLALVIVVIELVPLLAGHALAQSHRAAANGRPSAARDAALRAHALEPWAIAPLEQLALLAESRGDLVEAQRWVDAARRADAEDWQVRLLAARIETRRGAVVAARADLLRRAVSTRVHRSLQEADRGPQASRKFRILWLGYGPHSFVS